MFNAHFYNNCGGRSKDTIAPRKKILISTMKTLLATFDDWDGFVVTEDEHLCYDYDKNYKQHKQQTI